MERRFRLFHVWGSVAAGGLSAGVYLGQSTNWGFLALAAWSLLTYLFVLAWWLALFFPLWTVRRALPAEGRPLPEPKGWPQITLTVRHMTRQVPAPVQRTRPWLVARVVLALMAGASEARSPLTAWRVEDSIMAAMFTFLFTSLVWTTSGLMRRYVGWAPARETRAVSDPDRA